MSSTIKPGDEFIWERFKTTLRDPGYVVPTPVKVIAEFPHEIFLILASFQDGRTKQFSIRKDALLPVEGYPHKLHMPLHKEQS